MTDPDFRALCTELLDALQGYIEYAPVLDEGVKDEQQLVVKARAALAQPEPVAPTDEEIMELMPQQMRDDLAAAASALAEQAGSIDSRSATGIMRIILNRHAVDHAHAVLARWGTPTLQPVPVSERPKSGEWVWHCYAGVRFWEHGRYNGRQFFIGDGPESQPATHWLPHHALPVPQQEVQP